LANVCFFRVGIEGAVVRWWDPARRIVSEGNKRKGRARE